jgi:hypothetical protein
VLNHYPSSIYPSSHIAITSLKRANNLRNPKNNLYYGQHDNYRRETVPPISIYHTSPRGAIQDSQKRPKLQRIPSIPE